MKTSTGSVNTERQTVASVRASVQYRGSKPTSCLSHEGFRADSALDGGTVRCFFPAHGQALSKQLEQIPHRRAHILTWQLSGCPHIGHLNDLGTLSFALVLTFLADFRRFPMLSETDSVGSSQCTHRALSASEYRGLENLPVFRQLTLHALVLPLGCLGRVKAGGPTHSPQKTSWQSQTRQGTKANRWPLQISLTGTKHPLA